jgi:7,8-dihydropterin-6-yl-methyl-4-(beta-D-ribofuranosyl)aminobenzene 5'-phosphate synthase
VLFMTQDAVTAGGRGMTARNGLRLHVVFNNVPYRAGLKTGWGFSCLIEEHARTILFDTGGSGGILFSNMRQLGLDAEAVDTVVLSHIHTDHTGGLGAFLAHNPDVTVYMPDSFPASFQREVKRLGAKVELIFGPQHLFNGVYSTGEMGENIREQALILDTPRGLVLITGCAHPNVADMAEQAQTYLGKEIYLLMGGFHLSGSSRAKIAEIIARLKALGVRNVAPSHCTGENAIRMFRDAWEDNFIDGGLGTVIDIAEQ